ncbi:hypothetical protein EI427_15200 [Flammeovirga pectinis]|uniref:Putative carbohydrate metabolism domain-containing protein n=1 Tax=Flammeovirga pectinis TaxID=2494373 RepID=A0A3Q9FNE3_9BACT|nr:PCMD domain-containing protein [Flammeovirga pectinis]AZQ63520.1 hypothetical protein EI427_15200 [Flammeovirga pectinis]
MKILKLITLGVLAVLMTSCIDWDYFGLSPKAEILAFELEQQSGTSEIDSINRIIKVPLDSTVDRSSLAPTSITTSSLSIINPGVGEKQNFLDTVNYLVTAEDGGSEQWKVTIKESENQIPFSNFLTWFEQGTGKNSYFLPGNDLSSSPWRSGDKGAADVSFPTYPRTLVPMPSFDNPEYAQLETKSTLGILAAGSLFVGDIQGSGIADVQIDFGYNFTSKPISFTASYQYEPQSYTPSGATSVIDKSDIYVLLQVREDGKRYRLGTGWMPRSDETVTEWTEITVPIVLGESSFEDYMMPSETKDELPENGFYPETNARPTHIIVVFSSSAEGADLKSGGVGSLLRIKDFKLNY